MSDTIFKAGDVVILRSGGPAMTVVGPSGRGDGLICDYFEGQKRRQGEFNPATLKPYEKPRRSAITVGRF